MLAEHCLTRRVQERKERELLSTPFVIHSLTTVRSQAALVSPAVAVIKL